MSSLDELIVAGTGNEVMPVAQAGDFTIGNGKPGKITRMLQRRFFEMTYSALADDNWWKDTI
ncbi:MAG: hypothetical protein HC887_09445 [Desulfobacteraceae bacterium]|nr:hypothetical protein [Desulfobacteraceae bacterium]